MISSCYFEYYIGLDSFFNLLSLVGMQLPEKYKETKGLCSIRQNSHIFQVQ